MVPFPIATRLSDPAGMGCWGVGSAAFAAFMQSFWSVGCTVGWPKSKPLDANPPCSSPQVSFFHLCQNSVVGSDETSHSLSQVAYTFFLFGSAFSHTSKNLILAPVHQNFERDGSGRRRMQLPCFLQLYKLHCYFGRFWWFFFCMVGVVWRSM